MFLCLAPAVAINTNIESNNELKSIAFRRVEKSVVATSALSSKRKPHFKIHKSLGENKNMAMVPDGESEQEADQPTGRPKEFHLLGCNAE
jgi:hypothetical protein